MLTSPKLHIAIFAIVILVVTVFGIKFYDSVQHNKKTEAYSNLSTLATLKSNEVVRWVDAKTSDADYLFSNKNLQRLFRNYLIGPNVYTRNEIKELLTAFTAKSDYTDVILVRNSGSSFSFFHNNKIELSPSEEKDIILCRSNKKPFLSVLYRDSLGNLMMNNCIPMVDKHTQYTFGVLLLRIDPALELFPLISASPKGSNTAESFLVKRDGDSVLFLTSLKYRQNSALNLKLPLSRHDLPAAKAVQGYKGIFEGVDYRGTKVVADLDQIPGTHWYIISKIDLDEVYSPIRKQTIYILSSALGLIFLIGVMLYSFWKSEKLKYLNTQLLIEKEKHTAEVQMLEAQSLAHVGSWELDLETNKLTWSDEVYRIFGLIPQEFPATYEAFLERVHPDDRERVNSAYNDSLNEGRDTYEVDHRVIKYDSADIRFVHEKCEHYRNTSGKIIRSVGMVQDITERKLAEQALLLSEERFAKAFSANPSALAISRLEDGKLLEVNKTFLKLFGLTYEETIGKTSLELGLYSNPADRKRIMSMLKENEAFSDQEIKIRLKCGEERITLFSAELLHMSYGESILTIIQDITTRKQSEIALRESEARLSEAQQLARLGFYVLDIQSGLVELSEEMYKIFQIGDTSNKLGVMELLRYIHKSDKENFKAVLRDTIMLNKILDFEFRIETVSGIKHLLSNNKLIVDSEGGNKVFGTVMDITERKQTQLALEKTLDELRRSNKDLEQFAYTASHDLQEPIRMVKSYAQLFEYTNNCNDTSREYLKYIIEGASRMQDLVDGLLKYSRLSTKDQIFEKVDCNEILNGVLRDLKIKIEEENAVINFEHLPVITGNAIQLRQLFQNLIQNSLKFRSQNPPVICINSQRKETHWQFAVSDNGIGIDPQFYERIFIIFQRLNSREQYPGTGIGLAICKKIVQRHGGEIWVESTPEYGSTFYFTLPAG